MNLNENSLLNDFVLVFINTYYNEYKLYLFREIFFP